MGPPDPEGSFEVTFAVTEPNRTHMLDHHIHAAWCHTPPYPVTLSQQALKSQMAHVPGGNDGQSPAWSVVYHPPPQSQKPPTERAPTPPGESAGAGATTPGLSFLGLPSNLELRLGATECCCLS